MPMQPVQITVRLMLLYPSGDFGEKGWLMSADKCRELVIQAAGDRQHHPFSHEKACQLRKDTAQSLITFDWH